ncbi:PHD finger protein EHD3-like [Vigna unguiculata]|uniref:PHD finger protein EHD3-like n=1 Tax=Vigna unguiculata TaxID=3917 RepID=UPI001016E8A9|nr:PHD finger protein EHD3-like [Vigna unguiculata]XP_027903226.1 PHD finger protein EHD3-like [Vigna unguiculata]XP_027903227.1 PHD finger protein EHD3-like [Vigna unguiculata]
MDIEVTIKDYNCVAEEGQHLNSEAMNDEVAIAHANGVVGEVSVLKSEPFSNGVAVGDKGGSGGVECLRTYKRRKKSSSRGKIQEQWVAGMATASGIADQNVKKPCDLALGNTSDDCSQGQWGNIVLKHLYQSLGDGNGGVEGCIREALNPKQNHATTVMETFIIEKDGKRCSSQSELLSHRTGKEANRHADVMCNGCSSELPDHGVTEMCQRVLSNILTTEKFRSLCKALLENFQGMKPESVFDFTIMNSRMKEQAYEQSPALFLSDIQQVWGKLQDTGNEIVALAKSLSSISTTSYSELVGVSAPSTFREKQPSCNGELGFHVKPEQTQDCAMHRIGSCSRCGETADDKDCLVCDSCEEIYHVSCIEPSVKEIIPHKSWYCAKCTAKGIGSPHEHCVLCERLNDEQTPNGIIGDESFPTIKETKNEFEENSNCTSDGIEGSIGEKTTPICKICRNEVDGNKRKKVKVCGHRFCPNKYYHVRCLTKKQLKSYGHCWYCPSCICCVCLIDRDDDQIVICDGCDRGYHLYCLTPPQSSIPSGKWFCRLCDAGIQAIHKAKKAYESNEPSRKGRDAAKPKAKLDKKHRNKRARELERGGAMDMLLTAANTLNFEEKEAAIQIESQTT